MYAALMPDTVQHDNIKFNIPQSQQESDMENLGFY
jgi:hypothetical protein